MEYLPNMSDEEYALVSGRGKAHRKFKALAAASLRARTREPTHSLHMVHRLRLLNSLPRFDPPRHLDVYDFDDAIFLGSSGPRRRGVQGVKREARRCIDYMSRSRLVFAGNPYLADHARQHANWVEVIPSCVEPSVQPIRQHEDGDVITVGWIGSSSTSAYLDFVLPALERLNRARVRFRLVLIGAGREVEAPWVEHRGWSLDEERGSLASFDIGIMPLPDSDWARGKCAYKALQYFSAGVPVIASPVGMVEDIANGGGILTASSESEWAEAIERLAKDPEERRQRGALARRLVEQSYSYEAWAPRVAELLKSVKEGVRWI